MESAWMDFGIVSMAAWLPLQHGYNSEFQNLKVMDDACAPISSNMNCFKIYLTNRDNNAKILVPIVILIYY